MVGLIHLKLLSTSHIEVMYDVYARLLCDMVDTDPEVS